MRLTIAYSKIRKQNLVLINNGTYQRETLSERPIRLPLKNLINGTCMTFSHKIQTESFTWPDMSFYAWQITLESNKRAPGASRASCDIHMNPFTINLHFGL